MQQPLRAKSPAQPGQPGELLTSHLLHTLSALHQIRARIGTIPDTPEDFWTCAALAALLHDTGKIPYGFQRMVGNTPDKPQNWGQRHEVLSLGFVEHLLHHLPAPTRTWIAAVVAGHHRPFTGSTRSLLAQHDADTAADFLTRYTPADEHHLADLLRWLHTTARQHHLPVRADLPTLRMPDITDSAFTAFTRVMDQWEDALLDDGPHGRATTLLLGAVTMADHLSSADSPLDTAHPLTPAYPHALANRLAATGHQLRPQQQDAARTSGHMLLRSWTGSGKTEAVLLWAVRQTTELAAYGRGNPRVFYLLPYLASINAMTGRVQTELDARGRIGVAHSKAASYHLARSLEDGCPTNDQDEPGLDLSQPTDAAAKAHSRAQATKNFRELLRIGTPYQLLRGFLAGPTHAGILTDSANSVFVLDELHAYDTQRLGMILATMRFWHDTGGRIAVMSATLPQVLADLVHDTLDDHTTLIEPPPDAPAPVRHRLHLREAHLTDDATVDEIRSELTAGHSVLAVANNIRDAIALFEELQPHCTALHGEGSALLLHSRYRRMDRDTIEAALTARFGADRPRRPGLLVGTQALEVSLDLDLDICHTSAANLEALFQRFGRVNRLATKAPAPVIVHQAAYTTRRGTGDKLWADGVYDAEPTQLAWNILTRHNGQPIDEQTVTHWLNEIYQSPWGTRWRTEVEDHRTRFTNAFLTFNAPFADRSRLAEEFDTQFEGTEAIRLTDVPHYETALTTANNRKEGRLHADQYLIPLPHWATHSTRYNKRLRIHTIDAEYDPQLGLRSIHHDHHQTYQPGEVI
ncbi:CRISPR-associated helicase Cas3' [Actinacidiphila sp. bgisy144]|uniref:CRISPR-associated helicase Cas3' n=1 Tax=Actinacidiphila sp. bgisy144 TaxID=3413791 RepID=UPI003EB8CCC5